MKPQINWIRRAQRVIRMVSELHKRGYQRLRIMPYMHFDSNIWRLAIAPAEGFSAKNGLVISDDSSSGTVVYSAASEDQYFDWSDASTCNARELAQKFASRFSSVAKQGAGRDWAYAGWLSELLGVLEAGDYYPVIAWGYMKDMPEDLQFLPIWSASEENTWNDGSGESVAAILPSVRRFPLPPAVE